MDLLYRASEHKFKADHFHKKCDGVGNTIVLIQTKADKYLGGFSPTAWASNGSHGADNTGNSFIFTLE